MPLGFLNLAMLFGLVAVAIPVILHLLNRRRFDVVDWGAMQFLRVSERTRRRIYLEELLLLALRMLLIAVLVLALAAPFVSSEVLAGLGGRGNRDVVLVLDGSLSMGTTGSGKTPQDAAKEWATRYLDGLQAGDAVALLLARHQVTPLVEPTSDLARVRAALERLPAPRGSCDWPQAARVAKKILAESKRPQQEIVLLGDGQRFGWADERSLLHFELLAGQAPRDRAVQPRVWMVNVDPKRPAQTPNWSLAPLRASRAVAAVGQEVTFHTALELQGQDEYRPPHRLRLEIDGRSVADVKAPASARLDKGQVTVAVTHRFATPGSHGVSVVVEPDPPPEAREPGYRVKDHLPGDNRRDLAVEVVPALPVLLVDGDARTEPKTRGTDFLRDALAPARNPTPSVRARVVSIQEFEPALLTTDLAKDSESKPRVLVLADVPRLTAEHQEAVARFVNAGGGVLVTLGERADARHYNQDLYRAGQGWLPARLEELAGDAAEPDRAVSPLPGSFFHPTLELFRRESAPGGLGDARFPRWWRVTTAGRSATAAPVALFTNQDPFLVERVLPAQGSAARGRVLLCTVPLDNSARANLPNLVAYAPLIHELIFYLAGARSTEQNLAPGQPLVYRAPAEQLRDGLTLQLPEEEARPLRAAVTPPEGQKPAPGEPLVARLTEERGQPALVYDGTQDPGVYRLRTKDGKPIYYVVQAERRESDLTPCTEEDRARVGRHLPVQYEDDAGQLEVVQATAVQNTELWWWFLFAVVALLGGEVFVTRQIVKGRK